MNTQKQNEFDLFIFREPFQFERVTIDQATNKEIMSSKIKQIVQCANLASRKNKKTNRKHKRKADQKHKKRTKDAVEEIIK